MRIASVDLIQNAMLVELTREVKAVKSTNGGKDNAHIQKNPKRSIWKEAILYNTRHRNFLKRPCTQHGRIVLVTVLLPRYWP